ncbi:MAG: sn-glycerol-3-phosphate ABC transporter ATP-binding protein UgpC [Verrucomicrobiota bacterium JB022]|nr:sn-glycerol-3-phosphate ABC transporter ATP-binding protein UgpC [Verrucomicrobiota bacterium JB022]
MAKVLLQNLTKIYPGTRKTSAFNAVKGIDLEIRDREFMVLVGPSGCGKSTTLRMIAGLEEITSGRIVIDERPVNDVAPKDRDIAMVFQNYALYPHMTVYENMAFGLKLRKQSRQEIDRQVREAAAMLDLEPLLERKPKALSGGQRQRVAVGRAIVRKPKVFLFDEPLSNLDAKMRASTRTELSRLHDRLGVTMIYVTHDQIEAMTMGDRICVMNAGEIMQVADPLTLYNQPANLFVAGFIGSPPMNLIAGTLQRDAQGSLFVEDGAEGAGIQVRLDDRVAGTAKVTQGQKVVLGIRPEDVLESEKAPADASNPCMFKVDVSEPMGSETYLYLNTASTQIIARIPPTDRFEPGQIASMCFDLSKAHLFDAETEERMS